MDYWEVPLFKSGAGCHLSVRRDPMILLFAFFANIVWGT